MHCKDCWPIHTHCLKERSRSFHPSHTLSNCCIRVACVTHECLTISAQTSSLCLFVRASVLQSTECWVLTCPVPASLSFTVHVLCTNNENSYWESFCLYGGDTSRQIYTQLEYSLSFKTDLLHWIRTRQSIPPWGQIWFCVAFYFGLALLLVALLTHTQSQLNLKVCLSVSHRTGSSNPLYLYTQNTIKRWKGMCMKYNWYLGSDCFSLS